MSRSILAVFLVLCCLSGVACAQQKTVTFEAAVQPVFTKCTVDFHDGQYAKVSQKTIIELSAMGTLQQRISVRYLFAVGFSEQESFTPKYLKVGTEEWKNQQGNQRTPVVMDLSFGPMHRLDAEIWVGPFFRPLLVMEHNSYTFIAEGENNGKQVKVSENFDQTFCGIGAVCTQGPAVLRIAASKDYRLMELGLNWPVSRELILMGAYRYTLIRFEGLSVRSNGFFVQLGVAF